MSTWYRIADRIALLFSTVISRNSSSSAPGKIGLPRPKPEKNSQKIALLPIAPKFGTTEVNRFSQSPA